jgi:hypothetical protein
MWNTNLKIRIASTLCETGHLGSLIDIIMPAITPRTKDLEQLAILGQHLPRHTRAIDPRPDAVPAETCV